MPELPEIEATKMVLEKHILNQVISGISIYQPRLRWKIPEFLPNILVSQKILSLRRRAKYLLIEFEVGTLIVHLGMSGSLSIVDCGEILDKHTHFVINFTNKTSLRLKDPRRFGAVLWSYPDVLHPLLSKLGLEPLTDAFNTNYLYQVCQYKSYSIKSLIMDHRVVVGIGNIYALEVLFLAKISPLTRAKALNKKQVGILVNSIKIILEKAIAYGGTTLQDFNNPNGQPGYFSQQLSVYGRVGQLCFACSDTIMKVKQNQRSSYYCPTCQVYVC